MPFSIQPPAFRPLPLSAIRPRGWLARQLRIQADGLSGHLDEFWPDIRDSRWFGGRAEGWERAPYWLDGVLPLAWLLDDAELKAKAAGHMDYIIRHQAADGWLGPDADSYEARKRTDMWSLMLALKVLAQYGDIAGDLRAAVAVEKSLHRLGRHIGPNPLFNWGMFRSFEALIPLLWLHERGGGSSTGDGKYWRHDSGGDWLLDAAETINCQGFDWAGYFEEWPAVDRARATRWTHPAHVVNVAMALKAPALLWRLGGGERLRQMPRKMLKLLDAHHGQATGIFTGDECLAGPDPAQGTELCAVVEAMYSLEQLVAILGDADFADRLERLAFNCLPATLSPDMWSHQYVQQANQVSCTVKPKPVWTTDGPESNIFGLEPNYGCCTADFSQGWPKFAAHLWMATPDGGLAAISYAPCAVRHRTKDTAVEIEVETEYPFRDTVKLAVTVDRSARFPLVLRIPGWAAGATVRTGNCEELRPAAGGFCRLDRDWQGATEVELTLPMRTRGERRFRNSLSISRGPLVYALAPGEQWTRLGSDRPYREPPHADYEVRPTTPWNYAIDASEATLDRDLAFVEGPVGACPFSPEGAPVSAKARGRRLPGWVENADGSTTLPASPVSIAGPEEELQLLPYGCCRLRVTELPTLKPGGVSETPGA
jgi:hypothetical protein